MPLTPKESWESRGPIRRWRRRLGYTLEDLATETESSVSTVAGWEVGTNFPSYRKICVLARLMNRDPVRLEYAIRSWSERRPEKG